MISYLLALAVSATFASQEGPELPSVAPLAGTYLATTYVTSAEGSGCVLGAGSNLYAEVSFPGLSGKTNYIRSPFTSSTTNLLTAQTLTVTKGFGTDSLSGTLAWSGAGTYTWNVTGTFTASITEVSSHAFMMKLTNSFTNCTEVLELSLVRTGIDNN